MLEANRLRVAVNGCGVIGQRVAAAGAQRQDIESQGWMSDVVTY